MFGCAWKVLEWQNQWGKCSGMCWRVVGRWCGAVGYLVLCVFSKLTSNSHWKCLRSCHYLTGISVGHEVKIGLVWSNFLHLIPKTIQMRLVQVLSSIGRRGIFGFEKSTIYPKLIRVTQDSDSRWLIPERSVKHVCALPLTSLCIISTNVSNILLIAYMSNMLFPKCSFSWIISSQFHLPDFTSSSTQENKRWVWRVLDFLPSQGTNYYPRPIIIEMKVCFIPTQQHQIVPDSSQFLWLLRKSTVTHRTDQNAELALIVRK